MTPPKPLRIAVTADLHYGSRHTTGSQAVRDLAADLLADPPDLLLLGGDIGAADDFDRCLELFQNVPCRKALVPGNHDVWVRSIDARGDSNDVYERLLPQLSTSRGFHYLDHGPLLIPESDVAVIGTMNWYDYTWDHDLLREAAPDWEERLRTKRFTRGMHNDANFVRFGMSDEEFTRRVVDRFEKHLQQASASAESIVVMAHHPPVYQLLYPGTVPPSLDQVLWRAFSGNTRIERLIHQHAERIRYVFCGHTHYARDAEIGPIRAWNVGGDYRFKRLIRLNVPSGDISVREFHGETS